MKLKLCRVLDGEYSSRDVTPSSRRLFCARDFFSGKTLQIVNKVILSSPNEFVKYCWEDYFPVDVSILGSPISQKQ